jgi:DNA-binding transcriptional ArsR family regulator
MEPIGNAQEAQLDATFAALADPTRRAILAKLALGQASVSELAEPFEMTQPAISKHLKVLERAGLISRERDAQRRPSRLVARPLAEASEWLEQYRQFWGASFQRLDGLLESMTAAASTAKKKKRPGNRKR